MSIDGLKQALKRLWACGDAQDWLRESGCTTFAEAWAACPRGSWLAWLGAGDRPAQRVADGRWRALCGARLR
jgi:hypothetical protein